MLKNEFMNIWSFFHLSDNTEYVGKGEVGYDPHKKLGTLFMSLVKSFTEMWIPHRYCIMVNWLYNSCIKHVCIYYMVYWFMKDVLHTVHVGCIASLYFNYFNHGMCG